MNNSISQFIQSFMVKPDITFSQYFKAFSKLSTGIIAQKTTFVNVIIGLISLNFMLYLHPIM